MAYLVEISPAAKKALDGLPAGPQVKISGKIQALAGNPRPVGARKVPGGAERWCFPHAKFRIAYDIDDARKAVLVVEVGKGACA